MFGRGYHGDGSLATVHLVQPIPEENKPRVMSKRRTIKRVTIGKDRRKGACVPVNWSMCGPPRLVSMATNIQALLVVLCLKPSSSAPGSPKRWRATG